MDPAILSLCLGAAVWTAFLLGVCYRLGGATPRPRRRPRVHHFGLRPTPRRSHLTKAP